MHTYILKYTSVSSVFVSNIYPWWLNKKKHWTGFTQFASAFNGCYQRTSSISDTLSGVVKLDSVSHKFDTFLKNVSYKIVLFLAYANYDQFCLQCVAAIQWSDYRYVFTLRNGKNIHRVYVHCVASLIQYDLKC